jgi:hypothetical protein
MVVTRIDKRSQAVPTKHLILITIIGLVAMISFVRIWESGYVATIFIKGGSFLVGFFDGLQDKIFGSGIRDPIPYEYNYRSTYFGEIRFYTTLLQTIAGGILMVIGTVGIFMSWVKKNKLNHTEGIALVLMIGAGLAQVLFGVLYSGTSVGLIYASDIFVLFGLYALCQIKIQPMNHEICKINYDYMNMYNIYLVLICILIVIAALGAGVTIKSKHFGRVSETTYQESGASAGWIANYQKGDGNIIVDFNIFNYYVEYWSNGQLERIHVTRYAPENYAVLVGDRNSDEFKGDIFVVDAQTLQAGSPVHGYSGRALLEPEYVAIDGNNNMGRVYSDSMIEMYYVQGNNQSRN